MILSLPLAALLSYTLRFRELIQLVLLGQHHDPVHLQSLV